MIKEMIKRLFCRHKNRLKVPIEEITLRDVDNILMGLRPYYCNDCKIKFYDLFKEKNE